MIIQRPRIYVICDVCGKTIETNAADERIAEETAKREGWECQTLLQYKGKYRKPTYVNLCPKCKAK